MCFQPDELHRTLARAFPGLAAELPPAQSTPVQFVHGAVTLLERHGGLDAPFFAQLLRERPLRRAQIMSVAGALSIDRAAVASLGDADVTQVFRLPAAPDPSVVDTLEALSLERARCSSDDPQRAALAEDIEGIAAQLRTRRPPRAGDRVAGTILEYVLARGTFGAVWRAHDEASGAPRATKIFDPARLTDGIMVWRFRRSFRALTALARYRDAPTSIPAIFGATDDGLAFAMEYLPGNTLERLAERSWTLEHKISVFCEICRAVAFAHRAGVVHRDLKPNNIMFRADLRPVVIDFDIADVQFLTEHNLTLGGLGNAMFAAPEQLECAGEVDERADIFSLGRLLLYMLIDRVPSLDDQGTTLTRHPHVPPSLALVIQKATQRRPQDRHASVAQLRRDVEAYKTGWSACRASLCRSVAWSRRNAAILAFSVSGVGGSVAYARQQERYAVETERVNVAMKALADKVELHGHLLAEVQALQEDLQRRLGEARARLTRVEERLLSPLSATERAALNSAKEALKDEISNLERDLAAAQAKVRALQEQMGRSIDELRAARGDERPPAEAARDLDPPLAPPDPPRAEPESISPAPVAARSRPRPKRPSTLVPTSTRLAQVEETTKRLEVGLKRCRDRETKRWARVQVVFTVTAEGRVLAFKISPRAEISTGTAACVERNVRKLRFAPTTQQTVASFSMNFA